MALPIRSGIPTTFQKTNFRSRLEARWAAFFDLIGWRWIYEPFDTGNWIPDFLILGKQPFLVEVGPCVTWADYGAKAEKPLAAYPPSIITCSRERRHAFLAETCECGGFGQKAERITLVLGGSPLVGDEADGRIAHAAGLLTEDEDGHPLLRPYWRECGACDDYGRGTFRLVLWGRVVLHLPCGHIEGNEDGTIQVAGRQIEDLWREAGNQVQWHRS